MATRISSAYKKTVPPGGGGLEFPIRGAGSFNTHRGRDFLKVERHRLKRLTFHVYHEDPWARCLRLEVKNLQGKSKHNKKKGPKGYRRIILNWQDLTTYWHQRLNAEERKFTLRKTMETKHPNRWELFLRSEIVRIAGSYRRRDLALLKTRTEYNSKNIKWRKFFFYWSRRLGDQINRRTEWNSFFYSSVSTLYSQEKVRLLLQPTEHVPRSWRQSLKRNHRILIQTHRRLTSPGWNVFCAKAAGYLRIQHLTKRSSSHEG